MRSYQFSIRNRAAAIALGIAVVGVGIVVVVSGIALLVAVAAIAFVAIGGAMLVRRLLGRAPVRPVRRPSAQGFDPTMEVFPPEPADPPPGRVTGGVPEDEGRGQPRS